MRPHAKHLDDTVILQRLIDEAALDVDPPGKSAGKVSDQLLVGRWRSKGILFENSKDRLRLLFNPADARRAAETEPKTGDRRTKQLALLDDVFGADGPEPEIRRFATLDDALASISPRIRELQEECDYPLSEFAVLFPMRHPRLAPEIDVPVQIEEALDAACILWRSASQNLTAKTSYDITTDSVTLSTVHSAKGPCRILRHGPQSSASYNAL